jgi:hypothetical protein
VRLKGLLAIEIGGDLATEATEAYEALQLGVVGHMLSPPSELAAHHYR